MMVLVVFLFLKIFCFVFVILDIVHDVEAKHGLC